MTTPEFIAILILVIAILILLYYYLQDTRGFISNMRPKTTEGRTRTLNINEGISRVQETIKKTGSKATGAASKTTETGAMSGMSERMAGMSEKIKGKVKEVPISTDLLSNRIEIFLNEQSDQLIKDWELATKTDLSKLETRFEEVSTGVDELEKRFQEYKGFNNKKLDDIEERLSKLENPEDKTRK
jgi:hypothetical protein